MQKYGQKRLIWVFRHVAKLQVIHRLNIDKQYKTNYSKLRDIIEIPLKSSYYCHIHLWAPYVFYPYCIIPLDNLAYTC